ncbi:hypothetical protein CKM354_000708000 [Cercospora kikuchii]|uniref:Uncharacterized protein n=1 Tax=Cercospora kikuchii TaxID=84275 RepID=A0A9P3CM30_9PEZI|nr:uncharacterized protein CKM354_000708000 [Cercospora kikuchii]GIZ43867.1 hypothetical protein CKM354_000708000 [Cercospora kikuchii]
MSSIVDRAFTEEYNAAVDLYDDDKLEECITKAKTILADSYCPRHHRIKTFALLGNTLGDWTEAWEYYVEAHTLWRILRRWNPVGEDEKVDAALAEMRHALEALKSALDEEKRRDRSDCEDCKAV